jgi:hypothetical protein
LITFTADTHPDHDTICTFRRENPALLTARFVQVLQLAQQLKILPVGPITVAVGGTKVLANVSKQSAVSYERAGQVMAQTETEVKPLVAKAVPADRAPLQDRLSLPAEIARRQERKAAPASPAARGCTRRWSRRAIAAAWRIWNGPWNRRPRRAKTPKKKVRRGVLPRSAIPGIVPHSPKIFISGHAPSLFLPPPNF